jgi:hypothetical protein
MNMSRLSLDEIARIDFALTLRRRWTDVLYPALNEQYNQKAKASGVADAGDIEDAVIALPVYALAHCFRHCCSPSRRCC